MVSTDFTTPKRCPACGRLNAPSRTTCKHCRTDLAAPVGTLPLIEPAARPTPSLNLKSIPYLSLLLAIILVAAGAAILGDFFGSLSRDVPLDENEGTMAGDMFGFFLGPLVFYGLGVPAVILIVASFASGVAALIKRWDWWLLVFVVSLVPVLGALFILGYRLVVSGAFFTLQALVARLLFFLVIPAVIALGWFLLAATRWLRGTGNLSRQ